MNKEVIGVYFDDPKSSKIIRYAVGIQYSDTFEKEKILNLTNNGFKTILLPKTKCSFIFLTFRNALSFIVIPMFWNKIRKHVSNMKINNLKSVGIEVYSISKNPKIIEMYLPIDKESQKYQFSSLDK